MFNCGVMLGAIIFAWTADRLGRKPIHLACQFSMVIFGVAAAFAPNYITYVVLRFFLGAVREVNAYTLVEIVSQKSRRLVATFCQK